MTAPDAPDPLRADARDRARILTTALADLLTRGDDAPRLRLWEAVRQGALELLDLARPYARP